MLCRGTFVFIKSETRNYWFITTREQSNVKKKILLHRIMSPYSIYDL